MVPWNSGHQPLPQDRKPRLKSEWLGRRLAKTCLFVAGVWRSSPVEENRRFVFPNELEKRRAPLPTGLVS